MEDVSRSVACSAANISLTMMSFSKCQYSAVNAFPWQHLWHEIQSMKTDSSRVVNIIASFPVNMNVDLLMMGKWNISVLTHSLHTLENGIFESELKGLCVVFLVEVGTVCLTSLTLTVDLDSYNGYQRLNWERKPVRKAASHSPGDDRAQCMWRHNIRYLNYRLWLISTLTKC